MTPWQLPRSGNGRHERRQRIQGCHHAQIIKKADDAVDDQRPDQQPQPGFRAGHDHIELSDESRCQRNPGQREQTDRKSGGKPGTSPGQTPIIVQGRRVAGIFRKHSYRAERDERGDEIRDEIEGNGDRRGRPAGQEGDEQVSMCAIDEYASIRLTFRCASARRLPTNMDAIAMIVNTRSNEYAEWMSRMVK